MKHIIQKNKFAFTIVELLIAIVLFAVMITPMLFVAGNQNRNAYSTSKHLIASQICSSFMDEIMSKTYSEVRKLSETVYSQQGEIPIGEHRLMANLIPEDENNDLKKMFHENKSNFQYKYEFEPDEDEKIISVTITITYNIFDNKSDPKGVKVLHALKHGYKYGD